MKVSFNVRQLRQAQKLTQEQLEQMTGVHQSTISALEKGKGDPRISTIARLSQGLKVSPHALFNVIKEG